MILSTATKANTIITFRQGQNNKIIKGTLQNKNNHSNPSNYNDKHEEIRQIQSNVMHPKESKIEIELNENQINNTNYDVHSLNDGETSSSNSNNGDAKSTASNDEDKERKDDKGEVADRDVPDLIDQMKNDADSTVIAIIKRMMRTKRSKKTMIKQQKKDCR